MPRGQTAKTPELVAEVVRLRDEEHMIWRDIATRVGVSISTANEWYVDPDGRRRDARKDSYRGECRDCGAPTNGSNGRDHAPERCAKCALAFLRENPPVWGRDRVVEAIQQWAATYGSPPTAQDWNPDMAARNGNPRKAQRFWMDNCWPHTTVVKYWFGTWNAAIDAAGFASLPPGQRRDPDAWYEARWGKAAA